MKSTQTPKDTASALSRRPKSQRAPKETNVHFEDQVFDFANVFADSVKSKSLITEILIEATDFALSPEELQALLQTKKEAIPSLSKPHQTLLKSLRKVANESELNAAWLICDMTLKGEALPKMPTIEFHKVLSQNLREGSSMLEMYDPKDYEKLLKVV